MRKLLTYIHEERSSCIAGAPIQLIVLDEFSKCEDNELASKLAQLIQISVISPSVDIRFAFSALEFTMFKQATYSNRPIAWIQLDPIVTVENLESIVTYLVTLHKNACNGKHLSEEELRQKEIIFRKFALLSGGRAILFSKVVRLCQS